jgi:hypothetical protein
VINEDPKDALLRQYAEEIKALKLMLEGRAPMGIQMIPNGASSNRYK